MVSIGCVVHKGIHWVFVSIAVFAMFGMLSPASRGALMTAGIVLFMFMGLVASAGFFSLCPIK